MPVCKICGAGIPNRMKIDGKTHVVCNRTHCLSCVPFGSHGPRKMTTLEGTNRTCSICGRRYEYAKNKGHTLKKCNSCLVNERRFKVRENLISYKGGKCQICGYDKCTFALDFHHIDPTTKKFNISGCHTLRWDTLVAEVDKCILLCSNCHRELEYKQSQPGPVVQRQNARPITG